MSTPFSGPQFGTPSVPASAMPAPVDSSYPGGASSQFGMGMQATPPVPPTTLGGLLPAPDVRPSGKPKMPREIQGGPGTLGYEQRVADFAAENPALVQLADPASAEPATSQERGRCG